MAEWSRHGTLDQGVVGLNLALGGSLPVPPFSLKVMGSMSNPLEVRHFNPYSANVAIERHLGSAPRLFLSNEQYRTRN